MEELRLIVQKLMLDNEKKKLEISTLRNQLSKGSPVARLHQNGYISDENGVITGLSSGADRSTPTNSDSIPHKLSSNASPTPSQQKTANQPLDINTQLRKLLVDDVKENMTHSSSFPTNLCSDVVNNQQQFQHQHAGSFAPSLSRSQIPPSTSYLSSLSAGAAPISSSGQQNVWMSPRSQLHHTTSMFAQPTHLNAFPDGM